VYGGWHAHSLCPGRCCLQEGLYLKYLLVGTTR